jgi:hypothetical protein
VRLVVAVVDVGPSRPAGTVARALICGLAIGRGDAAKIAELSPFEREDLAVFGCPTGPQTLAGLNLREWY